MGKITLNTIITGHVLKKSSKVNKTNQSPNKEFRIDFSNVITIEATYHVIESIKAKQLVVR